MNEKVKKKLFVIFKKIFNVSDKTSIDKINYHEISHWDSLKHIRLVIEIEKIFKIKINEVEISELSSFKKILNCVEKHINKKN